MSELAYEFRPKGHRPSQTRSYAGHDSRLEQLLKDFEQWLGKGGGKGKGLPGWGNPYGQPDQLALQALGGRKYNTDDIYGLLVLYRDLIESHEVMYAGRFVSAVYCTNDETEIVFDMDIDGLTDIAMDLPEDKVFVNMVAASKSRLGRVGHSAHGAVINYSNTDDSVGFAAHGPVVNYGSLGLTLGYESQGLVVNLGGVALDMGEGAEGTLINFGSVNQLGEYATGAIFNLRDAIFNYTDGRIFLDEQSVLGSPGLYDYFNSLERKFEAGRHDYKAVIALLKELGPEPHKRIERDIRRIMRKNDDV